jgi:hypothetical protein
VPYRPSRIAGRYVITARVRVCLRLWCADTFNVEVVIQHGNVMELTAAGPHLSAWRAPSPIAPDTFSGLRTILPTSRQSDTSKQ